MPRRLITVVGSIANIYSLLAPIGPLALWVGGCCPCRGNPARAQERLNPPTMPMEAVVSAVNSNNARLPTLWASLSYSAAINDHGHVHSASSDSGTLLYQRPSDFRLVGNKEFVGRIFDIGTNDREFWLEVIPGTNTMWYGSYADLARFDPNRLPIPIRPDLVMEVLGVGLINPNFNALPAATMRYNNAEDAYVFVFNVKAPDRWLAQKEVWFDRQSLRPRRVILYDSDGRPVLQATLSLDQKVEVPDQPRQNWPIVAGDYKLFFPDSGSRMEFTLRDVKLYQQQRHVRFPNPASFNPPDVQGTDVRAIRIGGERG